MDQARTAIRTSWRSTHPRQLRNLKRTLIRSARLARIPRIRMVSNCFWISRTERLRGRDGRTARSPRGLRSTRPSQSGAFFVLVHGVSLLIGDKVRQGHIHVRGTCGPGRRDRRHLARYVLPAVLVLFSSPLNNGAQLQNGTRSTSSCWAATPRTGRPTSSRRPRPKTSRSTLRSARYKTTRTALRTLTARTHTPSTGVRTALSGAWMAHRSGRCNKVRRRRYMAHKLCVMTRVSCSGHDEARCAALPDTPFAPSVRHMGRERKGGHVGVGTWTYRLEDRAEADDGRVHEHPGRVSVLSTKSCCLPHTSKCDRS